MASSLPVDSSLFFKLIRVVNLTARPFHEGVGKVHHLSLNEWRVMVVLASHPGCVATDVAEYTGLDKMSVSRALLGLQKQGRVQREADALDKRRSHLWLTTSGKKLFANIGAKAVEREALLFAGLTPTELSGVGQTLDKLIGVLTSPEVNALEAE